MSGESDLEEGEIASGDEQTAGPSTSSSFTPNFTTNHSELMMSDSTGHSPLAQRGNISHQQEALQLLSSLSSMSVPRDYLSSQLGVSPDFLVPAWSHLRLPHTPSPSFQPVPPPPPPPPPFYAPIARPPPATYNQFQPAPTQSQAPPSYPVHQPTFHQPMTHSQQNSHPSPYPNNAQAMAEIQRQQELQLQSLRLKLKLQQQQQQLQLQQQQQQQQQHHHSQRWSRDSTPSSSTFTSTAPSRTTAPYSHNNHHHNTGRVKRPLAADLISPPLPPTQLPPLEGEDLKLIIDLSDSEDEGESAPSPQPRRSQQRGEVGKAVGEDVEMGSESDSDEEVASLLLPSRQRSVTSSTSAPAAPASASSVLPVSTSKPTSTLPLPTSTAVSSGATTPIPTPTITTTAPASAPAPRSQSQAARPGAASLLALKEAEIRKMMAKIKSLEQAGVVEPSEREGKVTPGTAAAAAVEERPSKFRKTDEGSSASGVATPSTLPTPSTIPSRLPSPQPPASATSETRRSPAPPPVLQSAPEEASRPPIPSSLAAALPNSKVSRSVPMAEIAVADGTPRGEKEDHDMEARSDVSLLSHPSIDLPTTVTVAPIAPISSADAFTPYTSPFHTTLLPRALPPAPTPPSPAVLATFTAGRKTIDPARKMCKTELAGGICADGACKLTHFKEFVPSDEDLVAFLASLFPAPKPALEAIYTRGVELALARCAKPLTFGEAYKAVRAFACPPTSTSTPRSSLTSTSTATLQ